MSLPPFLSGKPITDSEAGVVAHCHHPGSLYYLEGATLLHKRFSGGNISWGARGQGTAVVKRQESCVQSGCALAQCQVLISVLNLLSVWREEIARKCTPCLNVVQNLSSGRRITQLPHENLFLFLCLFECNNTWKAYKHSRLSSERGSAEAQSRQI